VATSLGFLVISLLREEGDWRGTVHRNVYLEIQYFKYVLWLPRYFRYSKVVIWVKSTVTRGDRSINSVSR